MAYEKQEWKTGDTITAEKLNNMEEGIDKAQNRYEINEVRELLFEGSLTTEIEEGSAAYTEFEPISPINANEIIVTFNGIEYIVSKSSDVGVYYGERESITTNPTFDTFPFFIFLSSLGGETHYNFSTAYSDTYSVKIENKETKELLFEGNLVTGGNSSSTEFIPINPINANKIIVTFNNTEYIVQKDENNLYYGERNKYGADYTTFPFFIDTSVDNNGTHYHLLTSKPGTYSIKIEGQETEIEISDDFKEIVKACSTGGLFIIHATDYYSDENCWSETDKTFDEIYAAVMAGLDPVIYCEDYGIERVYRLLEAYNGERLRFIWIYHSSGRATNSEVATLFEGRSTWEFN